MTKLKQNLSEISYKSQQTTKQNAVTHEKFQTEN